MGEIESQASGGNSVGGRRYLHVWGLALTFLAVAFVVVWRCTFDPEILFLVPHSPAEWIVYPQSFTIDGGRHVNSRERVRFRTDLVLPSAPQVAEVRLRAFRQYVLRVNGVQVASSEGAEGNWKRVKEHDVTCLLGSGRNDIEVEVSNTGGPPALWLVVQTDHLALKTDTRWRAQRDGQEWVPARPADAPGRFPSRILRPTVTAAWRGAWPEMIRWLAIALVLTFLGTLWERRGRRSALADTPQGSWGSGWYEWGLMVVVMILWVIMCANNIPRLAPLSGFDVHGHLEYVNFLRTFHRLPKIDQGWEMYQPPLYYVISACLAGAGRLAGLADADTVLPRAVSMAGGVAHVILVWSVARLLFPSDRQARCVALILAAAMPMNLYISQNASNEMMCAVLAAASLALALRIVRDQATDWRRYAVLGLVLGLAMLAKFTAVFAVAVVLVAMGCSVATRSGGGGRLVLRTAGVACAAILVVAGWFYVRNWALYGNPFVGNWDPALGYTWWTEPGYGTLGYYLRFGRVFSRPFESWLNSYGDSIYSTLWGDGMCSGQGDSQPSWRYHLMGVGYLISVFPSALMIIGLLTALVRWVKTPSASWSILLGHGALVAFGVFYMTLKLPYYPQAKAFYGLSCMACLCVLGGWGFNVLASRLGRLHWIPWIPLLIWAMNAYASFLAATLDARTLIRLGVYQCERGDFDRGVEHLRQVLKMDPGNVLARCALSEVLYNRKRYTELTRAFDAQTHLWLGEFLRGKGQTERGLWHSRCALQLNPWISAESHDMATLLYRQGRYSEAHQMLQRLLTRRPDDRDVLGMMVVVLSCCPDETVRDGRLGLELAQRRCKLTGSDDTESLDLLAGAQAELGRFAEAVATLKRAIALAEAAGKLEDVKEMRDRLALYESGRAYRYRPED
jgi:tetratricopeptide (TPR) repeat protein